MSEPVLIIISGGGHPDLLPRTIDYAVKSPHTKRPRKIAGDVLTFACKKPQIALVFRVLFHRQGCGIGHNINRRLNREGAKIYHRRTGV